MKKLSQMRWVKGDSLHVKKFLILNHIMVLYVTEYVTEIAELIYVKLLNHGL